MTKMASALTLVNTIITGYILINMSLHYIFYVTSATLLSTQHTLLYNDDY